MAIYDVNTDELINKIAKKLEEQELITPPDWVNFVKTGTHKERQPTQSNWWYIRAASVLRKIYKLGPIGVSKLRVIYGGRKNRGYKPEAFARASGNILRKVLQQLEAAELAKQDERTGYKGRVVTPKGHALLENTASEIMKEQGIVIKENPKGDLPIEGKPKKKKTAKKKTTKKKATKKKATKKTVKKETKQEEKKPEKAEKEEKPAQKEETEVKKAPEDQSQSKEKEDGKQQASSKEEASD